MPNVTLSSAKRRADEDKARQSGRYGDAHISPLPCVRSRRGSLSHPAAQAIRTAAQPWPPALRRQHKTNVAQESVDLHKPSPIMFAWRPSGGQKRGLDPASAERDRERRPSCVYGSKTPSPFSPSARSAASSSRGRTSSNSSRAASRPPTPVDATFDASRHVVLPGLINTHHHFYQTLTRAHPAAIDQDLVPWLLGAGADLGAADARRSAHRDARRPGRTAAVGLHDGRRPSLSVPARASKTRSTSRSRRRARLGLRMTVTRGSMSISEKDGGLPPDDIVQDDETILADSERVLKLYHDPEPGRDDPHRPGALLAARRAQAADGRNRPSLAERHDCRLHTHLCRSRKRTSIASQLYRHAAGRSARRARAG